MKPFTLLSPFRIERIVPRFVAKVYIRGPCVTLLDHCADRITLQEQPLYSRYLATASDDICLPLQAESVAGLDALDGIARTDGVDGVFIGPSDLSAALGHLGNPARPDVQSAIEAVIATILRAGKAAGILMADQSLARRYLQLGASFVAAAPMPRSWRAERKRRQSLQGRHVDGQVGSTVAPRHRHKISSTIFLAAPMAVA